MSGSDNRLLKEIKKISHNAGKIIISKLGKWDTIDYKNKINLVTDVDKKVENFIIKKLNKIEPKIEILSEESHPNFEAPNKWIIDPLDGTTNFIHNFPFFCVSIALMINSQITLAVVHDPLRKETFHAKKNDKAYLSNQPITVTKVRDISKALLATGFSYGFRSEKDDNVGHFKDFLYAARGVRRAGSAALDLCYVACGRLDGFWEFHLAPWDTAAGKLIVQEARGKVTNLSGKNYSIEDNNIVASNSYIHSTMLEILNKQPKAQVG